MDERTREQNRKFHAMVRDISQQVEWAGALMDEETWKRILLAAQYQQRIVPNPITGIGMVVVNNKRSRDLDPKEMSDFLMEIQVFGDTQGVKWSEDDGDSN